MDPRTGITEARQFLRDSTHDEHVRLNQHPLLRGITRPGYPIGAYRLVLAAYYHFYRVIEAAIDEALGRHDIPFSYEPRRKLQWIKADLLSLGVDPEEPPFRPSAAVHAITLTDLGHLLGTLYTIEGSSLGGQLISRHLTVNLGLTPDQGGRFFHGYGEHIASYWKQFEDLMDTCLTQRDTRTSAGNAARSTFALMEALLDDYAVRRPA